MWWPLSALASASLGNESIESRALHAQARLKDLGYQAPDRAGGVDADDHAAGGVKHKAGGLQVPAGRVDERASGG